MATPTTPPQPNGALALRLAISAGLSLVIVGLGGAGMVALISLRAPPKQREAQTEALPVEVFEVRPGQLSSPVQAYGAVRPRRLVPLAPEVSGRVIDAHPDLQVGRIIDAGAQLFRIDAERIQLRVDAAEARLTLLQANATRLRGETANLEAMRAHTRELVRVADDEVTRLERLLADEVGTISNVDAARRQALSLRTNLISVDGELAVMPAREQELQAQQRAAEVELADARLELSRATVTCPFRARIASCEVEAGAFLQAGRPALQLVDLAALEVPVALTGAELLLIDPVALSAHEAPAAGAADAPSVDHTVELSWGEGPAQRSWTGHISRLEAIDPQTRTFRLIVEVTELGLEDEVPLRVGMFCRLSLPGRALNEVVALPREAIEDGQVMVCQSGKLDFRSVEILRSLDDGRVFARGLTGPTLIVRSAIPYPTRGMALAPREPQ